MSGAYHIGALHAQSWSGLVLSPGPGQGFAFRFAAELASGARADGMDLFWLVHRVGPHAPDGSYARISFDLDLPFGMERDTPLVDKSEREASLVLEWGRVDEVTVVARVHTDYLGVLELIPFFPWDWEGEWLAPDTSGPMGSSGYLQGRTASGGHHLALLLPTRVQVADPSAPQRIRVAPGDRLDFVAAIAPRLDEARERARRALQSGVASSLAHARERYESTRVQVDGPWGGLASSITNNLHWMVLLKPETGDLYVPAGRRWIFPAPDGTPDHWTVFGWDSYFNALELAVESPELAGAAIRAGLATQYPTGCIPNWRGRFGGTPDRSQPPVGAFALSKIHARYGNETLIEESLPALEGWHRFWQTPKRGHPRRDGNADGLFEWGSDAEDISPTPPPWEIDASGRQRAAWESGQDDLPNWQEATWVEETETLDLACVDLNSYLAMDMEALAYLNRILGRGVKARGYEAAWTRLRDRMNETLWNPERGLYLDRKWNGDWSPRVAASNFLPLAAGVPEPDQARRMLETLTDPGWFWGDYVLPTISRNDSLFPEQQYWRGTIWPPMNYLVYQGLKRYAFDEVAGELARRSVALFLRSWREYQLCRENYDSRTGEGGGQRYQSWGPLFALIGLEEFLDVTPWAGLTVGSLTPPGEMTLRRMEARGRRWTVAMGPVGLRLDVDGRTLLASDAPVVLRNLEIDGESLAFQSHAPGPVGIRLEAGAGSGAVRLDGHLVETRDSWISIPPGVHRLEARPPTPPPTPKDPS